MIKSVKQPQCFTLAILLALGIAPLWYMGIWIGLSPFGEWSGFSGSRHRLAVLRDGTPVMESSDHDDCGNFIWHTLDGKNVKESDVQNDMATRLDLAPPSAHVRCHDDDSVCLSTQDRIRAIDSPQGIDAVHGGEIRYLVHDGRGRGYIVIYDTKTRCLTGYIGRDGFSTAEPPLERMFRIENQEMQEGRVFLSDGYTFYMSDSGLRTINWSWGPCMVDDGELLRIDEKKITRLRKVSAPCRAAAGYDTPKRRPPFDPERIGMKPGSEIVLLRYSDRVLVLDRNGKLVQSYSLPKKLRNIGIQCVQLEDGRAIIHKPDWSDVDELYWFNTSGKMERHESVDLRIPVTSEQSVAQRRYERFSTLSEVAISAPCGLFPGWCGTEITLGSEVKTIPQWPGLMATIAFSLFWAFLCFRQQRKYGLRSTWLWTTFALLFGLPAYLGYLAHRRWPVRLPCPHCGRAVPRDRIECFACGRDFPPPALKGIEIFA